MLAPIVIQASGWSTYFAFKMGNVSNDQIHYTYLKKGSSVGDLLKHGKSCEMDNNYGKGSKGDMIYQRADGAKMYYTGLGLASRATNSNTGFYVDADGSSPNGYSTGPFVGMMVIDTVDGQDGDMSGFGYLVHAGSTTILDYKLLNNHHSTESGDFSIGFISKTAIDFMWLSSAPNGGSFYAPGSIYGPGGVVLPGVVPGGIVPVTAWTLSVTGPDMSKHGLQTDGKQYSNFYASTVKVSQQRRHNNTSPATMIAGVYNNDEVPISGDRSFKVTCMGSFTHTAFMTPLQNLSTQWGGWTRKSIQTVTDSPVAGDEARMASGAIVYRADSDNVTGYSPYTTMQVETGGHLAAGHEHVNRPY